MSKNPFTFLNLANYI